MQNSLYVSDKSDKTLTEIHIFENSEFGKVRSLLIDNEPYFVGKDVAEILSYKDTADAIKTHVDDEDKKHIKVGEIPTLKTSNYGAYLINESGLYSLILSSKLPGAKKFKHWVTSEVLPSIRKNGGYYIPKTYSEALQLCADQTKKIEEMKQQVIELTPDAEFSRKIQSTKSVLLVSEVAKVLELGYGSQTLYSKLVDEKILMADHIPYQEYMNRGYFKVCISHHDENGVTVTDKTTKVYMKGCFYIAKRLGVLNHTKAIYEAYGISDEDIAESFMKKGESEYQKIMDETANKYLEAPDKVDLMKKAIKDNPESDQTFIDKIRESEYSWDQVAALCGEDVSTIKNYCLYQKYVDENYQPTLYGSNVNHYFSRTGNFTKLGKDVIVSVFF